MLIRSSEGQEEQIFIWVILSDQIWPAMVKKTTLLCILIQIFIIAFKIGLGRYGLTFPQRISSYGLYWLMARSPERIFEFWKQEKVTGSQIWRIRWLGNDFCFVFSQKFSHNQAGMWRHIIMVKKSMSLLPTNLAVYDELLHVDA